MQVLALGMPRTGTASITAALDALDVPCYHNFLMIANYRHDAELWQRALDWKLFNIGPKPDLRFWDSLLGSHGAIADLPAIIFAAELLEAYPSATVILIERDIEAWYKSFHDTIIVNSTNPVLHAMTWLEPEFFGRIAGVSNRWMQGWFGAKDRRTFEKNARPVFRRHYEEVRRITPRERLVEMRLEDGWEPICRVLGREVPGAEFPRTNESGAFPKVIRGYMLKSMGKIVLKLGSWVLVAAVAVGVARRYGVL